MYEHIAIDDRLRRRLMLALQNAVESEFSASDWQELGFKTGFENYIQRHDRLLRSLRFGDDDYRGCVLEALRRILDENFENLEFLLEHKGVRAWLLANEPVLSSEAGIRSDELAPSIVTAVSSPSEVVERALRDAEALVASMGAVSAIDRIHTALHGYFRSQCDRFGIQHASGASITELYRDLRKNHPALAELGGWDQEMDKVLKSFAAVLDALNYLRNHASLAHPNKNLLGEAEAELVINASRTILHYINTKVG